MYKSLYLKDGDALAQAVQTSLDAHRYTLKKSFSVSFSGVLSRLKLIIHFRFLFCLQITNFGPCEIKHNALSEKWARGLTQRPHNHSQKRFYKMKPFGSKNDQSS